MSQGRKRRRSQVSQFLAARRQTTRPLRIAQIAPPHWPSPPPGFGGSELVAGNLTEELVRRGYAVTLFAHPDSPTSAELVSFPDARGMDSMALHELVHVARALERASAFDIIHNHCLWAGPALAGLSVTPCLSTLHYLNPLMRAFREHPVVAISQAQRTAATDLNVQGVVYNGIDCAQFPVVTEKSDYLLFMGRLDAKKGPDLAVELARRLGMRLILAGPPPASEMRDYFETTIAPFLHGRIEYVGEARGERKIELLAHARCLLLPIRWEEPFGLVAAEAMACGTPVVGMRRGALPELVAEGETGFLVENLDAMATAVERAGEINPFRCRRRVEARFSVARMTDGYLALYAALLDAPASAARQVAIS